jgi:hypothetical protein
MPITEQSVTRAHVMTRDDSLRAARRVVCEYIAEAQIAENLDLIEYLRGLSRDVSDAIKQGY